MSAAQWFILGALVAVGLLAVAGVIHQLATAACREHYRRAGVRFDRHVDDALEVTR
ncbi:hypothetical protein [Nocardioides sp. REDSEA-S30_B4]|uniref:hypothetical protein n=1 Tax=Nocardioides sp. REDSEA-S30_B4 TaxID=1811552 RepID=UPI000B2DACCC|nr:hypothetical protein [Nocardioides sp. REDSEA-S30_B4]